MNDKEHPRAPHHLEFRFWTPPPGTTIAVGPEERSVHLPEVPLPVHRQVLLGGPPGREDIGEGLYDYLRQHPDCPHNQVYAELLRDAFSHYLADLGALALMLDHKEVDPPYVKRKINALKILALLEPQSAPLQQQIGLTFFQLALTFTEMGDSRRHLQQAMKHLARALDLNPDDRASLNVLAQIDYFLGDFPAAARRWRQVLDGLDDPRQRASLEKRLGQVSGAEFPDHPLVDEFEAIGEALEWCGAGRFEAARNILDHLEEGGRLPVDLPSAEFFFLIGLCREKSGDSGGACAAYAKSLELESDFGPAQEGRGRLLAAGGDDDA